MKSEKQKMLDGELYNAADPELVKERENARRLTRQYNLTTETEFENRAMILKELFGSTGEQFFIEPAFKCDYGYNIHIGENFYANFDCVIWMYVRFASERIASWRLGSTSTQLRIQSILLNVLTDRNLENQ